MDNSSPIKSPISEELEDFKKLFESALSSSNLLLSSVIAHIRQKNGKMMRPILVLLRSEEHTSEPSHANESRMPSSA